MNYLDLLLIFIVFVWMIYGAIRGTEKLFIGLFSVWLALVVDLWLFRPFSKLILQGVFTGASPVVMDSFAFIILMIILAVAIQLIFIFTSTSPEERRKRKHAQDFSDMLDDVDKNYGKAVFNALGGLVMGFITAAFWLSVLLALLQYLLSATSALGTGVAASIAGSTLVPYFNLVLRWVYLSVKLFTPGSFPVIFRAIL